MNLPFVVKLWIAELVLVFAETVSASAALEKFPSTEEEILQHTLENTDWVHFYINVRKAGHAELSLANTYWFNRYLKDDGSWESINTLARRSRGELEQLIVRMKRDVARVTRDATDATFAGSTLNIVFSLESDASNIGYEFPVAMKGAFEGINSLTVGGDGKIVLPEDLFQVDLRKLVFKGSVVSFRLPSILSAEITTEDENGNEVGRFTSEDTDWFRPAVFPDMDAFQIPMDFFTNPYYKRGKLKLVYRGGREETFNRETGALLERVLPNPRRISAIQVVYNNGVYLTIAGVNDGDQLVVDFAERLPRWQKTPSETVARTVRKLGNGEVTYFHPQVGAVGFFQARVEPGIKVR